MPQLRIIFIELRFILFFLKCLLFTKVVLGAKEHYITLIPISENLLKTAIEFL